MAGLQPTIDIGGNNNGMGNWGGALIGGAIGGAVGSAWGRGGNWNNGNCGGGVCCGNNGNQYVMESLTTMRSDVDSIGRDQLMETYPTAGTAAGRCYERGYALGHGSGYAEEDS